MDSIYSIYINSYYFNLHCLNKNSKRNVIDVPTTGLLYILETELPPVFAMV